MDDATIIDPRIASLKRGNDLIFPSGNDLGDYTEPLWMARSVDGARVGHGRTPAEAVANCLASVKSI